MGQYIIINKKEVNRNNKLDGVELEVSKVLFGDWTKSCLQLWFILPPTPFIACAMYV